MKGLRVLWVRVWVLWASLWVEHRYGCVVGSGVGIMVEGLEMCEGDLVYLVYVVGGRVGVLICVEGTCRCILRVWVCGRMCS